MKISCCIVAAGQGTRLGDEWADTPKALVPLLGRAMLYYSLEAFDAAAGLDNKIGFDRYVVAAPPDAIDDFQEEIRIWGFSRPVAVVAGGATRAESVRNTLEALRDDPPDMVMIHDCARACLTAEMLGLLLEASSDGIAATLAHPAVDTLRLIDNSHIAGEIDRKTIACLETPQIFPFGRILELHEQAAGNLQLPDDTTLLLRAGGTVRVVFHDASNMKITYPEDIAAAEGILFQRGWVDAEEGED